MAGSVTVSGWALDNTSTVGTAISSVQISVDGTAVGQASYGVSRPDVCGAFSGRPGCPNVGFTFALSTAGLSAGSHTITATATDTDSTPQSASASVTVNVSAAGPAVSIDSPTAGASVSGKIAVTGWALDIATGSPTAIGSITVLVDGHNMGNATYGISRPDVCGAYPGRPGCPNVGYWFILDTSTLSAGPHTVTVSAADTDGTPDVGSASTTISVIAGAPSVFIDSPTAGATVSGSITVSGWALDNTSASGTAISGVQILVDGNVVGNATYGLSRPDVCGAYPGRPGCPNVGFSFQLNVASLSLGSHVVTATARDSDGTPDAGSWSINVTVVAAPSVHIDSPAPGTTVAGEVAVSGWALDNSAPSPATVGSVKVMVDGSLAGTATYGVDRPDVCQAFGNKPGCPYVGFTFALNTTGLAPGSHTITVTAADTDNTPDIGSATVTVTVGANAPSVFIDSPSSGAVLSSGSTTTVSGWALDSTSMTGTAISGVKILVDGNFVGNATYGVSRPDVCGAYPGRAGCPNVGFSYSLNTSGLLPGPHTLTAVGTDSDGTPDSSSWTISFSLPVTPGLAVETPTPNSTVSSSVTVSGWAIDNLSMTGTAISSVKVYLDGTFVGNATYGLSRPDVCNAYPGRPGCPNVGFSYTLDLSHSTAGNHTITVTAFDSDGTPDSSSVTVTVSLAMVPSVFIDTPTQGQILSGTATISGWAIDNTAQIGSPINSVQVFVDGLPAGNATYGVSRPDVCAAYPGRAGCPNVGYTFQLNTAAYNSGNHVISVKATNTDANPVPGVAAVTVQFQ